MRNWISILLFLVPLAAPAVRFDYSCLEVIGRAAFNRLEDPFFEESDSEILIRYKNDAAFATWLVEVWEPVHFGCFGYDPTHSQSVLADYARSSKQPSPLLAPQTVDLSDDTILERSNGALCDLFRRTIDSPFRPTEYYVRVLSLREGDTVDFGNGTRMVLGKFRGRGNSAHIFELPSEPGVAVRIPLYTGPSREAFVNYGPNVPLEAASARSFLRLFVAFLNEIDPSIPRVEVLEVDRNFRWAKVTLLDGRENGLSFIKRLEREKPTPAEEASRTRLLDIVVHTLTLARTKSPRSPIFDWKKEHNVRSAARQFLEHKSIWTLVDPH